MAHPAVDELGRILILRVRDEAIQRCRGVALGQYKAPANVKFHERVKKAGAAAQELLLEVIPEIVDATMHYVLWTLDELGHQEPPPVELVVRVGDTTVSNVAAESDGLCGHYLDWIDRFSSEPQWNPEG